MVKREFMKIVGITWSDDRMSKAMDLCLLSMQRNGVERLKGYRSSWWKAWEHIDTFDWLNKEILYAERGAGFWLWKPWAISHAMTDLADGDILIYSDAGVEFIAPVSHIIDRMDENVFLFTNTHPNHHWTKRKVLDEMVPGWEKIYGPDTPWPQVQASVIFFRVCQETRDFVKRWLLYAQMPGFIDDSTGPNEEYPFYQEHRHDQSILSILATKAGYKLHWWPTAYAEHIRVPGDSYPVLYNHHRKRDHQW